MKDRLECWEIRGSCRVQDLFKIKSKYNLIEENDTPKPRTCIGYELLL